MLTFRSRRPNGGSIVIARAMWCALIVYIPVIGIREALNPANALTFSLDAARLAGRETLPWLGTIFGATYISLYARFSSQWTYLAELYNQIKSAEVSSASDKMAAEPLAAWKAGFIEDADDLHLSSKPIFASVIKEWGREPRVRAAFSQYAIGGAKRLDGVVERANQYSVRHSHELPEGEQVTVQERA